MLIYSFCPFVLTSRKVLLKKNACKGAWELQSSLDVTRRGLANLAIIHSTDKRRPCNSKKIKGVFSAVEITLLPWYHAIIRTCPLGLLPLRNSNETLAELQPRSNNTKMLSSVS